MRRIPDVLRLCLGCRLSGRSAATSCSSVRGTVVKYVVRAREAGLAWPLPESLDDEAMERTLFPVSSASREVVRLAPD